MPKYNNSEIARNTSDLYKEFLEKRGYPKGIVHFRTKFFGKNAIGGAASTEHIWSMGDRFYKLSYKHYGVYKYWWVIALFNGVPTEAHLTYGDTILIPDNPRTIAERS